MNCPNCGKPQAPNAPACTHCHTPLHTNAPHIPQAQPAEDDNERLMIFSDGVIAFALTIAAVSIRIPSNLGSIQIDSFILHFVSYILSFLFVYMLWKEHHTIFHHIKRNDGWLITLNSIYLAVIVLIPVGLTLINIEMGLTESKGYSLLLFLGSLFCAGLMLPLLWRHAHRAHLFGTPKPTRAFTTYTNWRLSALLVSMLFYIPAFVLISLGHWYIGVAIIAGFTLVRTLFFTFYRRRLQASLDISVGNDDITRIQLFSDAIIGIAITITAAQIDPGTINDAAQALSDSWSLLGTYVFSFVILGIYWLLHYHFFRFIKRYNATLLMLNFIFLLFIILMFIPARLYTTHMDRRLFEVIFSLWQFATATTLYVMWIYAAFKSRHDHSVHLLKRETPTRARLRLALLLGVNPLIFLALAIAGYFMPILTIFYIIAYLFSMGVSWLIIHLLTRRM